MPWATTNVASVILKFLSFTANRIIWNFHVVIFVFHTKIVPWILLTFRVSVYYSCQKQVALTHCISIHDTLGVEKFFSPSSTLLLSQRA